MTSLETPVQLRWSSVRDCPRKAVYEWEGAPARDRSDREERIMWRGRQLGREYVIMLATQQQLRVWVDSGPNWWVPPHLQARTKDDAGIIAELLVEWPHGTGHADLFIVETGTIIEVLSSANATDEMRRSKLIQAVGYAEHHYDARNVALIVLNPVDYSEDRTVVVVNSQMYSDLLAEVHNRLDQINQWRNTGQHPERVCGKPTDAIGHFCPFATHCFTNWQPPTLQEITATPDLVDAVSQFHHAKKERAALAAQDKQIEQTQKEAQTVIEQAELPSECLVGGFKVRRADVRRKPTLDWERAEAAGTLDLDQVAEFMKPGAAYSTFKVEPSATVGDVDYGEVPF